MPRGPFSPGPLERVIPLVHHVEHPAARGERLDARPEAPVVEQVERVPADEADRAREPLLPGEGAASAGHAVGGEIDLAAVQQRHLLPERPQLLDGLAHVRLEAAAAGPRRQAGVGYQVQDLHCTSMRVSNLCGSAPSSASSSTGISRRSPQRVLYPALARRASPPGARAETRAVLPPTFTEAHTHSLPAPPSKRHSSGARCQRSTARRRPSPSAASCTSSRL